MSDTAAIEGSNALLQSKVGRALLILALSLSLSHLQTPEQLHSVSESQSGSGGETSRSGKPLPLTHLTFDLGILGSTVATGLIELIQ